MNSPLPIGLGAGLVSAVLFASAAIGGVQSVLLLYLSPLPPLLAGLGWGWASAAVAAISGTVVSAAALGFMSGVSYFITLGLPIAGLCYLALLSREATELQPAGHGQPQPTLEWYPPGRLVTWAAVIAGTLSAISVPLVATTAEAYRGTIHDMLKSAIVPYLGTEASLDETSLEAMLDMMARVLPAAMAIVWLAVAVFNMWLAGRIVEYSGRALRPWPNIAAMTYPNGMALAFIAALGLSFLPNLLGIIAVAFASAFSFAYMLLGLVILHVITRPMPLRPMLLAAIYLSIFLFGWVAIIVAIIGLGDPIFKLRERAFNRAKPPASGRD